jgi:hypothetical protein
MWRLIGLLFAVIVSCGFEHGTYVAPYIGNVVTRSNAPDGLDTVNTLMMSRAGFIVRSALVSPKVVIANFASHVADYIQLAPGNAATVKASIEYPLGVCTPFLFSGSATGSVPNSDVLVSDALSISAPVGATAWYREWRQSAGGIVLNGLVNGTQAIPGNPMGDATKVGTSGVADQTTSCDTITDSGGGLFHPPLALIDATTKPSVCILGDSVADGAGSGPNRVGDSGAIMRSIGPAFSYINIANDSSTAAVFNTNANTVKKVFAYCSHLVVEWVNDINNGATLGQFETSLNTVYSTFSAYPKNPSTATIFQTTNTPHTTSTDSWATTANQTVTATESVRVAFNDALRAGSFGPNGGMFDLDSALETALDSGLWKAGTSFPQCGAPGYWTTEGVHPYDCAATWTANSNVIDWTRIHYPYLLNRDLDPASNDNGPVGLDKVA